MQTFVTRFSDGITAHDLDTPRLGKQRLETLQILKVLTGETEAWKNHPAVGMWRGYEMALCNYGSAMCLEWFNRGHKDALAEEFALRQRQIRAGEPFAIGDGIWGPEISPEFVEPPWRRDKQVLTSHRSNLIRKMSDFYSPKYPDQRMGLPYLWPAVDAEGGYRLFISQSELKRMQADGRNTDGTQYTVPLCWTINEKTGEVEVA